MHCASSRRYRPAAIGDTSADANAEVKGRASIRKPDTATAKGDLIVRSHAPYGADTSGIRAYFRTLSVCLPRAADDEDDGHQNEGLWEIIANSRCRTISLHQARQLLPRRQQRGLPGVDRVCAVGAHEAGWKIPDEARNRMLYGLERYVAGEVKTNRSWLPNDSYYLLSEKLIALEALSRYDRASKRLFDTVRVDPVKLTAASLADWVDIPIARRTCPTATHSVLQQSRSCVTTSVLPQLRPWHAAMTAGISCAAMTTIMARMFRLSMDARELAEFRIPLLRGLNNRMQRGGYFYSTQANLWAAYALERH